MLINVKMSTFIGILTLISMINTTSGSLKQEKYLFFSILVIEQMKFHARVEHEKWYNLQDRAPSEDIDQSGNQPFQMSPQGYKHFFNAELNQA